jgi:H+-transporting ATPase
MSDPIVEKKEPGPAQEPALATPGNGVATPDEKKKREYKDFGHEEEGPTRE